MHLYLVTLPGKFDSFFSLSSVGQGQWANYSEDDNLVLGARILSDAYQKREIVKRGKGYSIKLTLRSTIGISGIIDALEVLWDYADTCAKINEEDRAEAAAGVVARERAQCGLDLWKTRLQNTAR